MISKGLSIEWFEVGTKPHSTDGDIRNLQHSLVTIIYLLTPIVLRFNQIVLYIILTKLYYTLF